MSQQRIYTAADHFVPSAGDPVRSVVTETGHAVIVAWTVAPGQCIAAHVHPHGQDTWTILSGSGDYTLDGAGASQRIAAGDVAVAPQGSVHGVFNSGAVPLTFISVVCPKDAGYELATPA